MVRLVWIAVIFLALIGVAVVARRAAALYSTAPVAARANPMQSFDAGFKQHRALTTAHIIPGLLFMILGPLQFSRRIRARYLAFHRWSGRIFVASGIVIGCSALIMGPQMAIGGANEAAATTMFAIIFLFDLAKALGHIRRCEVAAHREWMIRAFSIGLAVATIRPIVGMFYATSRATLLTPQQFFGTAFWMGFTLHLIAAEFWIHYTRMGIAATLDKS